MSNYHWFSDEEVTKWNLQGETWAMLDMARQKTIDLDPDGKGCPFLITSGKRSPEEEMALKGGVRDSAHISGFGCDLSCSDPKSALLIVGGLVAAGFKRIIVYHDDLFQYHHIHVDNDPDLMAKTGPFLLVKMEQNG